MVVYVLGIIIIDCTYCTLRLEGYTASSCVLYSKVACL